MLNLLSARRPAAVFTPVRPTKRRGTGLFGRLAPAQDDGLDMTWCTRGESVDTLLWHSRVLSRRKPRLSLRLPGVQLLRYADRQLLASLFQLPPRITRFEPDTVVTPGRETWQSSSVELPGSWHVARGQSCWRQSGPGSPRPSYHRCTVLPVLECAGETWPIAGYKGTSVKSYGTSLSRRKPRWP